MLKRTVCLAVALAMSVGAGIRASGKYNGVIIFDRWGTCYLYSGVYLMYISGKVKESLRPYEGKPVLIDAQEVTQRMNPGDGLITKFKMLGPAVEPPRDQKLFGRNPNLDGFSLHVSANFAASGHELTIEVRNEGSVPKRVDTGSLSPTILMKKREGVWIWGDASDGPSTAVITRVEVNLLAANPHPMSKSVDQVATAFSIDIPSGFRVAHYVTLAVGEHLEVPLHFELPQGEYEFLAGYGGGVHEVRSLASNQIGFDVDAKGTARLIR